MSSEATLGARHRRHVGRGPGRVGRGRVGDPDLVALGPGRPQLAGRVLVDDERLGPVVVDLGREAGVQRVRLGAAVVADSGRGGRDCPSPGSPRRCARPRTGASRPTGRPAGCRAGRRRPSPVSPRLGWRVEPEDVKSVLAASYMLAHHGPSLNQSLLSGLVSVGSTSRCIRGSGDTRRRRRLPTRGRDRTTGAIAQPAATRIVATSAIRALPPGRSHALMLPPLTVANVGDASPAVQPVRGQMSTPGVGSPTLPRSDLIRTTDRRATPARPTDRSR